MLVDTSGNYRICCRHPVPSEHRQNIKSSTVDQWLTSGYLQQVRNDFENDRRHPGCHSCWVEEDVGRSSLRNRIINEYKILGVRGTIPRMVNVELQLGNLCNLTCIMCNEFESSAILAENRSLGINVIEQKDIEWDESAWDNLEKLLALRPRVLNIRGGEPFYNKDLLRIIENLPEDTLSTTILHVSTNATTWQENWIKALSRFRMVRMMLSIDAVGDLYEYIRFPAKWSKVSANTRSMKNHPNLKLMVHCVVQNLNVGYLGDLMSWCDNHDLYLEFDGLVSPRYLHMTNLPPGERSRAIIGLEECLSRAKEHQKSFLLACHQDLIDRPFDPILWEEFQTQMSMRESLRHNNHKVFLNQDKTSI